MSLAILQWLLGLKMVWRIKGETMSDQNAEDDCGGSLVTAVMHERTGNGLPISSGRMRQADCFIVGDIIRLFE